MALKLENLPVACLPDRQGRQVKIRRVTVKAFQKSIIYNIRHIIKSKFTK
jgi:hypothetical protein